MSLWPRVRGHIWGMVHVGALPGTPLNAGQWRARLDQALSESRIYAQHGLDGIILENMHDLPYVQPQAMGPEITAHMAVIAHEVRAITPSHMSVGIQILAGANREAMAVAQSAQLQFIRAEGFVFGHLGDEGWLESCAGQLLRYRRHIGAQDVAVFCDIKKKHSAHAVTQDVSIEETAQAAQFFLADGLIVTGASTGSPADPRELARVQQATPKMPVMVGSGVDLGNVEKYMSAQALIVGSHFKEGGHWAHKLDQKRIEAFMAKINLKWVDQNEKMPWIILDLESESQARQILSRSLSVKYCIHLWGSGDGVPKMHEAVKAFPSEFKEPYFLESLSFKVYVEAFMKKLTMAQRVERIETFDYLPIKGPIRMKDPDVIFSYFEYYGDDQNRLDEHPRQAFFGRFIGDGQRHLMSKLSIKTRKFIGNTTMDPLLSLFMANLSLVRPNDLVLDPFVGTGSIPVAAAQFGAFILGSDIDFLVIHAKTRPSRWKQKIRAQDESMKANFQQYGLAAKYLDVVVADSSRPIWARKSILNAIVTDPPYGIRETILKVGTEKKDLVIPEEFLETHYPQKVEYGISDVFYDLLNFGAESLCERGRLAFWLPVNREEYSEERLPRHPNLVLKFNVEQVLSCHTSRRLLVMEKVTTKEGGRAVPQEAIPDFRDSIQSAYALDKKDRKERIKKFGHLNLNGKCSDTNKTADL
ncbi:hypothetical protein TCAL_06763 [Tigriopus californicus]|uniref:tRNA (guanine(10)-N(2))-methyltransferase TRMT11 n=1 Tax=Tigriopus californicus TaxID=6832 RepID=A0A553PKI4_TIGCA|nr:hypothetical protein TCAL_06763 [Tigriopus californicus]